MSDLESRLEAAIREKRWYSSLAKDALAAIRAGAAELDRVKNEWHASNRALREKDEEIARLKAVELHATTALARWKVYLAQDCGHLDYAAFTAAMGTLGAIIMGEPQEVEP